MSMRLRRNVLGAFPCPEKEFSRISRMKKKMYIYPVIQYFIINFIRYLNEHSVNSLLTSSTFRIHSPPMY